MAWAKESRAFGPKSSEHSPIISQGFAKIIPASSPDRRITSDPVLAKNTLESVKSLS
jgi:hypothetical protein